MAKKKSKRIEIGVTGSGQGLASKTNPGAPGLTHSPFASLRGSLGEVRESDTAQSASGDSLGSATGDVDATGGMDATKSLPSPRSLGGTVIVRHERKGHGGKTVTVADLSRADWAPEHDLEQLAKGLRKALGAGARAGDQCITVQGDQVERVAAFFRDSFGANVTLGTR